MNKKLSSTGSDDKKRKREKHSKNMYLLQKNLENVVIGKNILSLPLWKMERNQYSKQLQNNQILICWVKLQGLIAKEFRKHGRCHWNYTTDLQKLAIWYPHISVYGDLTYIFLWNLHFRMIYIFMWSVKTFGKRKIKKNWFKEKKSIRAPFMH